MTDPSGLSIVEFYGTVSATIPLKPGNIYKPFQNVIFTNSGIKYLSDNNMMVLNSLTINNGASLNNTTQNTNIFILGNWIDNNSSVSGFVPGTGMVYFQGTVNQQQITVINNIGENFYDMLVNNSNGVNLITGSGNGNVIVSDELYLTNGVIFSNSLNSLTLSSANPSAVVGGSESSFVDGPLIKQISGNSYFNFPVGNEGRFGNVFVSAINNSGTYTGQYFNTVPPYNINTMLSPINQVSNNEYWWVSGPSGSQGNVQLRWDVNSGFSGSSAASRTRIRAIEWFPTPGQWEDVGAVLSDGGPTSGTVQTDNPISLASGTELNYLTLGVAGLPTATIMSSLTPSICNDGVSSTTVSIVLTGTAPWTLSYKLGAVTTTLSNIATSPASIILTSLSAGIAGIGNSDFNITNVNDALGISGVGNYSTTVVLNVKPVPSPSINGTTTVGTSQTGISYSTSLVGSDTYVWSVIGGTIASGQNTSSITVNWGSVVEMGNVSVIETNSAPNNCSITNTLNVSIETSPTPNVTGNTNVCSNATNSIYTTPYVSGHTYVWTVTGGTFTGPSIVGSNDQISITWGVSGSGSVQVSETFVSTVISVLAVTINPLPSITNTLTAPAICYGQNAEVTINNSDGSGTDYQLYIGSIAVSGAYYHNTTAGANVQLTVNPGPISNTVYNVVAINQYSCSLILTNTASVIVNPLPDGISDTSSVCVGSTVALNDATPDGTWSSGTPTVAAINNFGQVNGVSPGSSTITYILGTGCSVNYSITVNPLPAVITGTSSVCVGSSVSLNDLTSGGTWSSGTPAIATVNPSGLVSGSSSGSSTITYFLATGCSVNTSILVNPLPDSVDGVLQYM